MSDHDAAPDPMDKAYAQSEAVLSDEAARAARRARVLAAVAREPVTPDAPAPPIRRSAWRHGGWVVAAGVAGLSVLVATQVSPPGPAPRLPAAKPPEAPAMAAPEAPETVAPGLAASSAPAAKAPAPQAADIAPRAEEPTAPDQALRAPAPAPPPAPPAVQHRIEEPAPPPPPAPAAQPSRAPPAAAAQSSNTIEEMVVVTGERRKSATELSREIAAASPTERAARLRDAAAAGRTAEVTALLARHVPVDAADEDGETALMKAVQENQPPVAALLRRRGASLDLKNHAGASARDMAKAMDDAKLDQALGLRR